MGRERRQFHPSAQVCFLAAKPNTAAAGCPRDINIGRSSVKARPEVSDECGKAFALQKNWTITRECTHCSSSVTSVKKFHCQLKVAGSYEESPLKKNLSCRFVCWYKSMSSLWCMRKRIMPSTQNLETLFGKVFALYRFIKTKMNVRGHGYASTWLEKLMPHITTSRALGRAKNNAMF